MIWSCLAARISEVIDTNFVGCDVLAQTRPEDAGTCLVSLGAMWPRIHVPETCEESSYIIGFYMNA